MYSHVLTLVYFPCIPKYSLVFLCIPMYFLVFSCIPLQFHVFFCIPMYSYLFPCIPMYSFVFPLYSYVFPCNKNPSSFSIYTYHCLFGGSVHHCMMAVLLMECSPMVADCVYVKPGSPLLQFDFCSQLVTYKQRVRNHLYKLSYGLYKELP